MGVHGKIIGPPLEPWIDYMDDKSEEPSAATLAALEGTFGVIRAKAFGNVHVISGALLKTFSADTEVRRTKRRRDWTGTITLGRGVDYLTYESSRKGVRADWLSHPSHDWQSGLDEAFYPNIDAILNAMD